MLLISPVKAPLPPLLDPETIPSPADSGQWMPEFLYLLTPDAGHLCYYPHQKMNLRWFLLMSLNCTWVFLTGSSQSIETFSLGKWFSGFYCVVVWLKLETPQTQEGCSKDSGWPHKLTKIYCPITKKSEVLNWI